MTTRPFDPWPFFVGGIVLALVLLGAHILYPRYDWRTVGSDGHAVVVYDRWSGRFQRAEWDQKGKLFLMDVYAP
jgi:hypothetical protein